VGAGSGSPMSPLAPAAGLLTFAPKTPPGSLLHGGGECTFKLLDVCHQRAHTAENERFATARKADLRTGADFSFLIPDHDASQHRRL